MDEACFVMEGVLTTLGRFDLGFDVVGGELKRYEWQRKFHRRVLSSIVPQLFPEVAEEIRLRYDLPIVTKSQALCTGRQQGKTTALVMLAVALFIHVPGITICMFDIHVRMAERLLGQCEAFYHLLGGTELERHSLVCMGKGDRRLYSFTVGSVINFRSGNRTLIFVDRIDYVPPAKLKQMLIPWTIPYKVITCTWDISSPKDFASFFDVTVDIGP
jgi:hypothetical protein